jgi:hypothetical protein
VTDDKQQQTDDKQQQRRPSAYKRGQLVTFVARDETTGGQLAGIGVVTRGSDGGGHLVVRPLADHDVTVDPGEVEPVVVDEV